MILALHSYGMRGRYSGWDTYSRFVIGDRCRAVQRLVGTTKMPIAQGGTAQRGITPMLPNG